MIQLTITNDKRLLPDTKHIDAAPGYKEMLDKLYEIMCGARSNV